MIKQLVPRPEAYELYWQFAHKRQQAFEARIRGDSQPWTEDPILQQYKFCNVFRAADRVSQYMIRNVCYSPEQSAAEDRIFQIVAFRTFSHIETWETIRAYLNRAPIIDDLVDGRFERAVTQAKEQNGKIYTNAFILCASDAYGQRQKHLNHIELFKDMFVERRLGQTVLAAQSLQEVYNQLHAFPLMGDFMSYQTAIDINYSDLINFSENDFTKAGPGALRGIKKVFTSTEGYTPEEVIVWMVEHQDEEFERLGLTFNGLFGRKLHGIDAQGLFCETDKYCRQALPELASARVRIKSKFTQNTSPIELFFPPKWHLGPSKVPGPSSPAVGRSIYR